MAQKRILLFTKTTGYRHDSLTDGVDLIKQQASADDVIVDHTEDAARFTVADLSNYDAVVWLQVSGDVLDEAQRAAFDGYLRGGGGFAAIHGPADAEWSWPEYEDIVGARFLFHPKDGSQVARVIVETADPSTEHLPKPWEWREEWYSFKRNPRGEFDILLRIDESSYDPEEEPMGDDHPVSWRGRRGNGKTWYTSLGHHPESYRDPDFTAHLWGGISSVLRDSETVA